MYKRLCETIMALNYHYVTIMYATIIGIVLDGVFFHTFGHFHNEKLLRLRV